MMFDISDFGGDTDTNGAIVGIVIACVAVLAIVTGIIIYLKKNSSKPKSLDMSDSRNDLQVPNKI